MNSFYFEQLRNSLENSAMTPEGIKELVDETKIFLSVLRVKLESGNPALQQEAAREIRELKQMLTARNFSSRN